MKNKRYVALFKAFSHESNSSLFDRTFLHSWNYAKSFHRILFLVGSLFHCVDRSNFCFRHTLHFSSHGLYKFLKCSMWVIWFVSLYEELVYRSCHMLYRLRNFILEIRDIFNSKRFMAIGDRSRSSRITSLSMFHQIVIEKYHAFLYVFR